VWCTLAFVLYLREVGTCVSGLPVWCNFCGALHVAFIQFSRILCENLTLKCSQRLESTGEFYCVCELNLDAIYIKMYADGDDTFERESGTCCGLSNVMLFGTFLF
jgi:hypothetical protein